MLIFFFNYFYTFLQLEPKDVADQLKRRASIPGVRPGAATAGTSLRSGTTLTARLCIPRPARAHPNGGGGADWSEHLPWIAGTSLLILVGVATDATRKVRSELVMAKYDTSLDDFYGSNDKKKK